MRWFDGLPKLADDEAVYLVMVIDADRPLIVQYDDDDQEFWELLNGYPYAQIHKDQITRHAFVSF